MRDDFLELINESTLTYTNLINFFIFILLILIPKYIGTKTTSEIKIVRSNFENNITFFLKKISNYQLIGYLLAIILFFITYTNIPSENVFHFKNIPNLFQENNFDKQLIEESRFQIYESQLFSLIMTKFLLPFSSLTFFKARYRFLPFLVLNILNMNMYGERQGLIILSFLYLFRIIIDNKVSKE